MSWFEAIIYGLIQGLSEFLPVSSSGHLALLPYVMSIPDPGVVFDLTMHLGTAMAVIIYFRKDIMTYARTLTPALANFKVGGEARWFTRNFIYATFVSIFFIVLLLVPSKFARNPWVIIFDLSFFGLFLWLADIRNRKLSAHLESPMENGMQWKAAALIGAAQAFAIFPGVSRSGITLSVALALGMKRKDAGEFSFLLSLPIILAGIFKEIPDLLKEGNSDSLGVLILGVVTSFIVGWLTIHFFMKLIGKIDLKYFAIYRWLLAGLMAWSLLR
ncbi:MAG: undecaprenyl-diphosphate phosphatase [Bacteriovoracaceae bacterium]